MAPSDFDSFIHEIKVQMGTFAGSTNNDILCVNWGHIIGTMPFLSHVGMVFAVFVFDVVAFTLHLVHLTQTSLLFVDDVDGNLHCNIVSPGVFEKDPDFQPFIDACIFDAVVRRHGSISAEHGLGQYKNKYLPKIKEAPVLGAMVAIKQQFDPHGIMNPGKYFAH